MKKKILFVFLVFILLLSITGCGKKDNKEKNIEEKEPISGGWEILKENESYLPIEVANLFYKATINEDSPVLPIVLLGKQVVAGTNYMFLVQKDGEYFVYVIYEDLENNTSISSRKKFDLTKYTNENIEIEAKVLSGGWIVEIPEEDKQSMKLDENTQKVFDKATEKLTGMSYYPLSVLGKQIVAGTNYAVIAYGTPSTKDPVNGVYILTLYKDLTGNCEMISSSSIDLSEYND